MLVTLAGVFSSFVSCTHPIAVWLALALLGALSVHAVVLRVRRPGNHARRLAIYPLLLVLTLWLGWYPYSPLGFAAGRIPVLRGFLITELYHTSVPVVSGQTITLAPGAVLGIQPETLPGPVHCLWASATGGAFDDSRDCDTAYTPASGAGYDVLRIVVESSCGIPAARGEIKIALLP